MQFTKNATVTQGLQVIFVSKYISASTTAGFSAARFFEMTSPALLKICLLGTDVGGAVNTWQQGSVREGIVTIVLERETRF